jgi:formate dehydrogenase subunit delta
MSGPDQLVQMANDIGNFFRSQPNREEAVVGIANHIQSFWTTRMREKIFAQVREGASELDELPRDALRRLMQHPSPKPQQPAGGDAG